MKVVYAHEFGSHLRSSAYKYYLPLQKALGGEIVGVRGRDDHPALSEKIRASEADVVMVRGDRSSLFVAPLEAGIPYVVCENDVSSWRQGTIGRERTMLENAAAVVFTSEAHRDHLVADGVRLPISETVWLRPTRASLDFDPLPKLGGKHLVYAGGLLPWNRRTGPYGYRSYHRTFEAFIGAGWQVHLYPSQESIEAEEYKAIGCHVHDRVPAQDLYREMSQYTAGLHGYSWHGVPRRSLDYALHCMPNKTWEYLAAGIPTITINGGVSARTVVDGGWGVEVGRDLAGLDLLELPAIDPQVRLSQTIDGDVDRLAALVRRAAMSKIRSGRTT